MVTISHESIEETDLRLRGVMRGARMCRYDKPYAFVEYALDAAPPLSTNCLAAVRDDLVWSFLTPALPRAAEVFTIWRFHFPESIDNSGFVGWLAGKIKQSLGTGVFVVCGQNSADGGIFDYWGCPVEMGTAVQALIDQLRDE